MQTWGSSKKLISLKINQKAPNVGGYGKKMLSYLILIVTVRARSYFPHDLSTSSVTHALLF